MSKSSKAKKSPAVWAFTIIGTLLGVVIGYAASNPTMAAVLAAGLGYTGYFVGLKITANH